MRKAIVLAAVLFAAGCSDKKAGQLQHQMDEQQASIAQLEKQIAAVQDDQQKLVVGKLADVQRYARQVGLAQMETARAERNVEQQFAELRQQLKSGPESKAAEPVSAPAAAIENEPAARTPAYTAAVSVYQPTDPVLADFIEPPAGTNTDTFPVLVADVQGHKIVTGSHTTTRPVPTKETYVDDFGATVNRMKTEEFVENEYGYQVAFSLRNLTRTAKELVIGAGRKNKTITLQAGETLSGQTIDSANGADLSVRVGASTRRFPVSYGE